MERKDVVVETRYGKLLGEYKNGLYIFKGVPYAEPPLGERRWRPPEPLRPWEGIKEAKKYGFICPQVKGMIDFIEGFEIDEPQSEDCLYLNLWTPSLEGKRPVMVFIHGGAFLLGSSSSPLYRGGKLALRGDVVLVTINYRLGPFGFLNLKDFTDGRIPATGNEGLLDQIQALRWVKENIEVFGGDPSNVTVFGESAGAMSIACLLVMEEAKGLFHKAILESGSGSVAIDREEAFLSAQLFMEIAGIKREEFGRLKDLTVKEILRIEGEMMKRTKKITPFSPVIDGLYLKDQPINLMREGKAERVPLLLGTNLDEWNLFSLAFSEILRMDEKELLERVKELVGDYALDLIKIYRSSLLRREKKALPWEIFSAIETDRFFRIPSIRIAEAFFAFDAPVFFYLFSWPSPSLDGLLGACHTLELGFVFGNFNERFFGSGPSAEALSIRMQEAWTSFAHSSDPSGKSIGFWPKYGKERKTMILDKDCYVEEDPYGEERRVWDKIGI